VFNVVTGVWPLLDMRSFERVTGPKVDHWLVQTVGGLLVGIGLAQLTARSPEGLRLARVLGVGTAGVLATIDLANAPQGRISKVYLLDAAAELAWVASWFAARSPRDP
jgi:hypothetical protein